MGSSSGVRCWVLRIFAGSEGLPICHQNFIANIQTRDAEFDHQSFVQKGVRQQLGVGSLQETLLKLQHGSAHVKSWQPISNSWATSSEPDYACRLGRRDQQRRVARAGCRTQHCSIVGQVLVSTSANSPSHGNLQGSSMQGSSGNYEGNCNNSLRCGLYRQPHHERVTQEELSREALALCDLLAKDQQQQQQQQVSIRVAKESSWPQLRVPQKGVY